MALIEDGQEGDQLLGSAMSSLTAQIQAMAARFEESIHPEYWVTPPIPLSGNDVPIPPYAVIAIVQNPNSSALAVGIGALVHSVPALQLAVFPTLKGNVLTSSGPGTVIFSNRYQDRGFVQQGASSGSGPSPATTVVGPDAYSAPSEVGVSVLYARGDHDHGLPAAPPGGTPATAVTGPDAYGASAVVGVNTNYARQDHDHGLPAAPADIPLSTITAAGDLIRGTGPGVVTNLGVGSTGQSLIVSSGEPAWGILPMTTTGDLEYASSGTAAARLAIGTAYQELATNSGATAPNWATGILATLTATADICYASAAHVLARLGIGTAYQELAVNAGATAPSWFNGILATLTTTADICYASAAHTLARLGIGSTGQVLTVAGGVPTWATPSSGYPLTAPVGGTLGSNVTLPASTLTTIMTSASLAVGTWLVTFTATVDNAGGLNAGAEITINLGTATATFAGGRSAEIYPDLAAVVIQTATIVCLVTVTVAGTLLFQGENPAPSGSATVETATTTFTFAGATGYTATRVA